MALSDAIKAAGELRKDLKAEREKKQAARAKAQAEADRRYQIRLVEATTSYDAVMQMVKDHNASHPVKPIRLQSDEPPVVKCTYWTILADCKDRNCHHHYAEKKAKAEAAAANPEQPVSLTSLFGF